MSDEAQKLRETGNGPDVSYEEALLREVFGDPDGDGVYGYGLGAGVNLVDGEYVLSPVKVRALGVDDES